MFKYQLTQIKIKKFDEKNYEDSSGVRLEASARNFTLTWCFGVVKR